MLTLASLQVPMTSFSHSFLRYQVVQQSVPSLFTCTRTSSSMRFAGSFLVHSCRETSSPCIHLSMINAGWKGSSPLSRLPFFLSSRPMDQSRMVDENHRKKGTPIVEAHPFSSIFGERARGHPKMLSLREQLNPDAPIWSAHPIKAQTEMVPCDNEGFRILGTLYPRVLFVFLSPYIVHYRSSAEVSTIRCRWNTPPPSNCTSKQRLLTPALSFFAYIAQRFLVDEPVF